MSRERPAPNRSVRGAFVAIFVIAYMCAALYPFAWRIRGSRPNGADRDPDGALRFETPGIVSTPGPPEWLAEAIRSSSLRLRADFRPLSEKQTGPARIFTISENQRARNLTIGQENRDLIIRLRHAGTSRNGIPPIRIPGTLDSGAWLSIDIEVNAQRAEVRIDGELRESLTFQSDPFATWSPHYAAAAGNELNLWRPWLGSIRQLDVSAGGKTIDLLREPGLERPPRLDYPATALRDAVLTREAYRSEPHDLVQNILGFVPFGILVALLFPRSRAWGLLLGALALSLTMESSQLLVDGRKPSPTDLATNLLGGAVGIWAARRWLQHRVGRQPPRR